MSASIFWEPVKDREPTTISTYAPSSFMESMALAGFTLPCTLSEENKQVLFGMSVMHHTEPNPYKHLLKLIDKYKIIRLWAEY